MEKNDRDRNRLEEKRVGGWGFLLYIRRTDQCLPRKHTAMVMGTSIQSSTVSMEHHIYIQVKVGGRIGGRLESLR